CAIMFVLLAVVLLLLNRPEIKRISGVDEYVAAERAKLGRMSEAERNTLIAFAVTVTLWVVSGIVALVAGDDSAAYTTVSDHLDEGVVAVLGAALLFVLPTRWSRREFTLTWSEASKIDRSEEHTSELQSRENLVCRLLLEKKNEEDYERPTSKVTLWRVALARWQ